MTPSNWLRSLRNTRERSSVRKTRPRRKATLGRKLNLERLEDRTLPATVTILGSHLITAAGRLEAYSVSGFLFQVVGNQTITVGAGTYSVDTGSGTDGTFTISNQDTVSGTTGALVPTGNTIDFDLTQLAAVTMVWTDLKTAAGFQQGASIGSVVDFNPRGPDTLYLPAGSYNVYLEAGVAPSYGTFTVGVNGSGALVVTATSGAAVATGNTIDFDLTKLAAVTMVWPDLKTAAGFQQGASIGFVVDFNPRGQDTVYLPAGSYNVYLEAGVPPAYGTFTVGVNASCALVVTATSGAAVATGNIIDFDLTKLAAVTMVWSDLKTAAGFQQGASIGFVVDSRGTATDTVYLPAGSYTVYLAAGVPPAYGTFTVGDNASGAVVVTATSGAAVATGDTIDFDLTKLAAVTMVWSDLKTAAGVQQGASIGFVVDANHKATDTAYLPAGSFTVYLGSGVPPAYGTFTISPNASGGLGVTATSGALIATTPNQVDFEPCALEQVQVTPNPGVYWYINFVTGGFRNTDVVGLPDGSFTLGLYDPSGNFSTATFSVGPSGLSATQLPATNPLVTLQLVPCQDATTTIVTASLNPSMLNQSVTFTANVSAPDGDVPTGTVQFLIDNVNFGSPVTLANGSAGITTANLSPGPHTIQAVYGGNSDFLGSSGSLTQNVQYCFDGFRPPLSQNLAFALNRTIPIKWQLCDFNGALITSLSAVTSLQIAPVNPDNSLGTPFNPTPTGGTSLRNDGSQYIFNWQTKGLAAGTYEILLTLSDGTLHTKVLQLSKNGSSAGLTTTAAGGTGTAPGGLLGGDITLYVDNTNGDLTADELTRIQDAVTAADGVTEPYGVAVTEVTDPTLADVTLNMDTTSAVGGYAAGVLGCTTDAGQITIIDGWNFYARSDATQIGSAQFDFETVVTHELGHALGLGHSTDSTSVMYATLNTGAVNRTLTTADLNVPDTGTSGACGLHAVGHDSNRVLQTRHDWNRAPQDDTRDLLFAFAGTAFDRLSAPMGSETRAEPSGGVGDPRRTQVDALFARESERPIFAAQSQRDTEDALFDVPLFPVPDATDGIADFIAADSWA
jgi:hypothetical protein